MSADRRQSGLTLVELIIFIVIVSVGLAGVLSVFNVVVRRSADPLVTKQALAVADAMLEEILLKDFCDPTPAVEFMATTVAGSAGVTGISPPTAAWTGWRVSGNGIPAGTTVAAVVSPTALTLSAAATSSGSGVALRVLPCTGSVEATRADYDDVGDYNGYATTGIFSPTDLATPISGLGGYNVSVSVAAPAAAVGGVAVDDVRQVTVTVTFGSGTETYVLTGYRFNHD